MLNPGTMLSGRYEIIELVGSGGMSEVYKAKCHVLNRYVAIKVLKPEFSSDVNFVTKFRIEAQSAAGLSHPNIVNVYDVGEDNGIYYIVMELVEGTTLKEYIQAHGRIEPMQAIDFAIQIAQGSKQFGAGLACFSFEADVVGIVQAADANKKESRSSSSLK